MLLLLVLLMAGPFPSLADPLFPCPDANTTIVVASRNRKVDPGRNGTLFSTNEFFVPKHVEGSS